MSHYHVVLLLGTNLGDKKKNIETAIAELEKRVGPVIIKTEILETNPVEFVSFNIFFNFALLLATHLSPIRLLNSIKSIEQDMGRNIDSKQIGNYADRIIDIDIVEFSNLKFSCKKLEIPHIKHLLERDFSKQLLKELNTKKTQM